MVKKKKVLFNSYSHFREHVMLKNVELSHVRNTLLDFLFSSCG